MCYFALTRFRSLGRVTYALGSCARWTWGLPMSFLLQNSILEGTLSSQ